MSEDNVIKLKKPDVFVDDPITDILRQEARNLLTQALEAEIEIYVHQYKDLIDELGRQRVVRDGYLPKREIQTGIGPVPVKAPQFRDRAGQSSDSIYFNSSILPPYLRKTKSLSS